MRSNPSVPTEMRKELRYRLGAPAVFFWEGAGQRRFQGEGITRDISVQGAFILTATTPPPEGSVHLDLLLPPLAGMDAMLRITGRARVVRVDNPPGKEGTSGFAVVSDERNQWGLTTIRTPSEMALAKELCAAWNQEVN